MNSTAIETIRSKIEAIPQSVRPAINGSVARIRRIYAELTGLNRSRAFFYKEGQGMPEQRTLIQRVAVLYFSDALASPRAAAFLAAEFESWQSVSASLRARPLIVTSEDIWRRVAHCSELLQQINQAWGGFDHEGVRVRLVELRLAVDEMIGVLADVPSFEGNGSK